jgi:two-component system, chemotaxis family, protein-glutamate methylesterase/glutaminase
MIDLVLIGGSAGSLDVILTILDGLEKKDLPAIVIVLHRKNGDDSTLTELLAARSPIPVKEAEEKDPIVRNTIYLAPSDYHLLIERDRTLSLDYSEKQNYSRPSIDVTFETAADAYREAAAAIVLSGANADGSEGLEHIAGANGLPIVQEPATADVDFMPRQALNRVPAARVMTPKQMQDFLNALRRKADS